MEDTNADVKVKIAEAKKHAKALKKIATDAKKAADIAQKSYKKAVEKADIAQKSYEKAVEKADIAQKSYEKAVEKADIAQKSYEKAVEKADDTILSSPIKLDKLPSDIVKEVGNRLPNREYTRLRMSSKFLQNLFPASNLNKYDIRNYFKSNIDQFRLSDELVSQIREDFSNLEYVREYQENEAKILYLVKEFDKEYDKIPTDASKPFVIIKIKQIVETLIVNANASPGDILFLGQILPEERDRDSPSEESEDSGSDFFGAYIMTDNNRYIEASAYKGPLGLVMFAKKKNKNISYENATKLLLVYWEEILPMLHLRIYEADIKKYYRVKNLRM